MEREYTPIVHLGKSNGGGDLLLMIKIYPYGKMTQHLASIKVGMYISWVLQKLMNFLCVQEYQRTVD